jgi:glutathione synthase
LSYSEGRVVASVARLELRNEKGNHYTLGEAILTDLSTLDVILMRQDPPFDMAYITATYFLEMLPSTTRVLNNPTEVRNCSEKIFVLNFPQFIPPTLISRDAAQIKAFAEKHGDIIIKPLYGHGGSGVFRIPKGAPNLSVIIEVYQEKFREPFIAQGYIKGAELGDKRIIMLDGEPVGAMLRVPAASEHRANLFTGGTAVQCELTARDREIAEAVGGELKKRGLVLVGLDVVGGYLTEINVTSPTGVQEINKFNKVKLESQFWDVVEGRVSEQR